MKFAGKVSVVTGAASGIGRACARELARGGASVALVDSAVEEKLSEAAREMSESGAAQVLTFRVDVSAYDEAGRVLAETRERLGGLDILVNAAGVTDDAPLWEMSEAQWARVIDVNLNGSFNYIRWAARIFREQRRGGKIVNIASIEGMRGRFGISNYAASKAGVLSLTRSAAIELGRIGVNVNAVAPGFIRTPMTERLPESIREAATSGAALGRLGEPEDVASVVAFLCSDEARFITGETVKVDGGLLV